MSDGQIHSMLIAVKASYVDAAKRDIVNALSHFRDLHPNTEHYVFNDGSRRQLVTLNGTLPVNYKGNTYNIPVCLYLLEGHPYYPPMCYVRPTPDMMIKVSEHVDNSGKIYLPYLHEWRHPQSDLIGLLQIMSIVFGEGCPVFSRSAAMSQPVTSSYSAYPPYPSSSSYGNMPQPQTSTTSGYTPYPSNRPPYPSGYGNTPSNMPSPYQPYSGNYGSGANYTTSQTTGSSNTIQPEHIRISLASAVEDKLRSKLRDMIGTAHAELQSIKKTREDLNNGEQALKLMLSKIGREQDDIETAMVAYRTRIEELDRALAQSAGDEEFNIDDAVDTTTPLFRQLLTCYVEDSAIEDTIYYLGQALKRGHVDLENYLKHVRTLSRKQFMLRATMQRCRIVAGLDA